MRDRTRCPKVFVAMSGGVDSSVAALMLKQEGYDVTGVFMKNWSETKNDLGECAWREEKRDAERVAAQLGIPFLVFDFEEEYRRNVIAYLDREYAAGRTPNPDIMCNQQIKFGAFYRRAIDEGADLIATGHYAQVRDGKLLKAVDQNKDQTYFLYRIDPTVLRKTLFPIGHLTKPELRKLAKQAGLATAEKKDSQGLCFVGKIKMHDFLKARVASKPGKVLNMKGEVIGTHDGAAYYTIGQRHGLNLGIEKEQYIVSRNIEANTITVTDNKFDPALMRSEIALIDAHWLVPVHDSQKVEARIRYREPLTKAEISIKDGATTIIFENPEWAPAPGQSVVCYDGEVVLGGGIIK
ncbi:MAG: tRNA 2-thiouridine(34) synthase MnmA [bacterium]